MAQRDVATVRRIFFRALLRGFQILWPAVSGVLTSIMGLGAIVGLLENWGIAQGVYFSFVTGLTIGYGDLAPSMALTKLMAVLIGLLGIVLLSRLRCSWIKRRSGTADGGRRSECALAAWTGCACG